MAARWITASTPSSAYRSDSGFGDVAPYEPHPSVEAGRELARPARFEVERDDVVAFSEQRLQCAEADVAHRTCQQHLHVSSSRRCRRGEFPQGGQKQLVHLRAQVGQGRGAGDSWRSRRRVRAHRCRRGGADGKTQAGNAIRAELFERLVGVGFRVTAFVAVVVGETVRKDEQQPIRCAGLGLENFARTADAGAEARIARLVGAG